MREAGAATSGYTFESSQVVFWRLRSFQRGAG